MQLGGKGNKTLSDINITPLVDVMLVLLVIFMVTAPMMSETKTQVQLPSADTGKNLELTDNDVVLVVDKQKDIRFFQCKNCAILNLSNLVEKMKHNQKARDNQKVYLLADRELSYRFVLQVMAKLREAGIPQVGLVTNPSAIQKEKKE